MISNPYLSQRFGDLSQSRDEPEFDASEGFSRFPNAAHMTSSVFKPSSKKEPVAVLTPTDRVIPFNAPPMGCHTPTRSTDHSSLDRAKPVNSTTSSPSRSGGAVSMSNLIERSRAVLDSARDVLDKSRSEQSTMTAGADQSFTSPSKDTPTQRVAKAGTATRMDSPKETRKAFPPPIPSPKRAPSKVEPAQGTEERLEENDTTQLFKVLLVASPNPAALLERRRSRRRYYTGGFTQQSESAPAVKRAQSAPKSAEVDLSKRPKRTAPLSFDDSFAEQCAKFLNITRGDLTKINHLIESSKASKVVRPPSPTVIIGNTLPAKQVPATSPERVSRTNSSYLEESPKTTKSKTRRATEGSLPSYALPTESWLLKSADDTDGVQNSSQGDTPSTPYQTSGF
ncbi:hypothetical protein AGDE_12985 [Angomonas deanei]|uniref:Uncharacterized protein n=1 Tax=Angomonas deanei TaxID=59799 RepID=A0A7G2C9T3_9TRYP|nr:hypothetical protein AGDE_12985 [Angomonas deanei]CAD2216516.1 hypothetical protein, conserved [Angomonas deanei]|eukprot:EPY23126.1 hypothetical protein AGDE_12985 [Angomonas deanei]